MPVKGVVVHDTLLWLGRLCSHLSPHCRYLVTHLMGADLNNIVKTQKLSDDHVQFLVYQILRGLKVGHFNSDW